METQGGIYTWWHYFRKGETTGQVATLITLAIAIIFLFVAVTLNISKVGQRKTATAKAADGAAIKLASFIGSYGNKLSWEYLDGKTKKCTKRWGTFFGILAAVVLTILMGIFGPKPSGCKEIGGVVEFEIPADRTLTDIQKTFIQKMSRSVFDVLAGISDVKDVDIVARSWLQRFWAFISSPIRPPRIEMAGQSEDARIALHHFDFRIRPVCYGGENPGATSFYIGTRYKKRRDIAVSGALWRILFVFCRN